MTKLRKMYDQDGFKDKSAIMSNKFHFFPKVNSKTPDQD